LNLPPQEEGWLNWTANQAFAEVRWLTGATVVNKQNNSFVVDPLGKASVPWTAIAGKAGLLSLLIFQQNLVVGACLYAASCFALGTLARLLTLKSSVWCTKFDLEKLYESLVCSDVDINFNCGFEDFLWPNEHRPDFLTAHLANLEEGIFVSTGTERVFFELLFANETTCKGVVVRDINHRVKAYIDFNVLLLRLAKDRQEYCQLSAPVALDRKEFEDRIHEIKEKIGQSSMSPTLKNYYLKNLAHFSQIYFKYSGVWKEDSTNYGGCFYHLNDDQFLKLQRYAQAGSIICTIGTINDLEFLGPQKVAMVDVSNIPQYTLIHLKGLRKSIPRIVWTYLNQLNEARTKYCSCKYEPLNENETREFDRLYSIFTSSFNALSSDDAGGTFHSCCSTPKALAARSKLGLKALKNYVRENIIEIPAVGIFNLRKGCVPRQKIVALTDSEMLQLVAKVQKTQQRLALIDGLIHDWEEHPVHQLSMLINDNQWIEVFEIYFREQRNLRDLTNFIAAFKAASAYETLEQKFGKDRLQKLQCI